MPAERRARDGAPSPYRLEAFFNRRQRTPLSAWLNGTTLEVTDTYPELDDCRWIEDDSRGDGTVPSFSSVPIEWEDTQRAFALAEKHAQMQAAAALHDNLFNWLRPHDVRGKKGTGVDDADVIALDVPASCTEGDEVIFTAAAARPTNGFIEVVNMETAIAIMNRPIALAADRPQQFELPRLGPAAYRVTTRVTDRRLPAVSDDVFVAER